MLMDIDEELAEKVMGWHKHTVSGALYWLDKDDVPQYLAEEVGFDHPWSPQQNIADAWMIVERLRTVHCSQCGCFSDQWNNFIYALGDYMNGNDANHLLWFLSPDIIAKAAIDAINTK
jgi:hypothetical protein